MTDDPAGDGGRLVPDGGPGGSTVEGESTDEEQTERYLVTDSNLRSAWVTAAAFVVIVFIEGFSPMPTAIVGGVLLGPLLYYLLNAVLDETQRGLATFGAVGAFVAAVILGYLEPAVWVALGVDVGTLATGYVERKVLD